MDEVFITTADNPYSPFDQYDLWRRFDVENGYNTESYLARIARTTNEMTDEEYEAEIERAIDEIIYFNLTGNYKKVRRSS